MYGLGVAPLPVTVTFWTFELVAGETGSAFHQPKREENTKTTNRQSDHQDYYMFNRESL